MAGPRESPKASVTSVPTKDRKQQPRGRGSRTPLAAPLSTSRLRRRPAPCGGRGVDCADRIRVSASPVSKPRRRASFAEGARVLAGRDPIIARLVEDTGLPRLRRSQDSPFAALVRAIVYQQLAGAAARAIHGRLLEALG